MSTISEKYEILLDDNKETNNVQLEQEIYQQINLIKLDDFDALPLEEMGEEIDLYETETNLANNVVPKPEKFHESSRRNTHFLRP